MPIITPVPMCAKGWFWVCIAPLFGILPSAAQKGRALLLQDRGYACSVLPCDSVAFGVTPSPVAHSLKSVCPIPADQDGEICFAYAMGYEGATVALRAQRKIGMDDKDVCSPGYLVHRCKPRRWFSNRHCSQSGHIADAALVLQSDGIVSVAEYPNPCSCRPTGRLRQKAARRRLTPTMLVDNGSTPGQLVSRIKWALAADAPVVVSFLDFGSFDNAWGKPVWRLSPNEVATIDTASIFHAACIVGYDDTLYGGAFELMNSWGTHWGRDGFIFIPYDDLARLTSVAIALKPLFMNCY